MANLNLLSPFARKRHDEIFQYEDQGRPARTLAGSHIADLVHLKKTILLCETDARKFQALRHGYVTKKNMPRCVARCDACKEQGAERHVFVHQSHLPYF